MSLDHIVALVIILLLIYTCRKRVKRITERDRIDELEHKRKIAKHSGHTDK
jgi:uncharacterized membrane protein